MGVEELRASLEREGRARMAALLGEAEAEAARLREDSERAAARRRAEELGRHEVVLRREARARVAAARAEARRRVLEAREELLARVFERAADDLRRALEAPDARPWLVARAREAQAHLPEGPTRWAASSGVANALGTLDDVRVENDPELPAGFRASSADGSIAVDVTVPILIGQARSTLAIDVLAWLEGEGAKSCGDPA